MEGGKEQNYWPGFVDALSNVVLTLVFVLVIFVFALLMASNKVAQKMGEVVNAEKNQQEGQAQLNKALAELEQLRAQEASSPEANKNPGSDTSNACVKFNKSDATQKVELAPDQGSVLIFFGINAISVVGDTIKALHDFVEYHNAHDTNHEEKFVIEASEDPTSQNPLMARETQLGRMLNIRNSLLTSNIPAYRISIHDIPPLEQEGGYNWVSVHVEK
jgi:hypothetical protein